MTEQSLDSLFEEEARRVARDTDAFLSRPDVIARGNDKRKAQALLMAREIEEGVRLPDGSLIEEEEE